MSRFNRQKNQEDELNLEEGTIPENQKLSEQESFRHNYNVLRNSVAELQDGDIEHIDDLLPLIDKASRAYHACIARIDAVSKMVDEEFEQKDLARQ